MRSRGVPGAPPEPGMLGALSRVRRVVNQGEVTMFGFGSIIETLIATFTSLITELLGGLFGGLLG